MQVRAKSGRAWPARSGEPPSRHPDVSRSCRLQRKRPRPSQGREKTTKKNFSDAKTRATRRARPSPQRKCPRQSRSRNSPWLFDDARPLQAARCYFDRWTWRWAMDRAGGLWFGRSAGFQPASAWLPAPPLRVWCAPVRNNTQRHRGFYGAHSFRMPSSRAPFSTRSFPHGPNPHHR
jgi:hypothetical protein